MVKNLFLVRHAEAELQAGDQRDFQRVLSPHGLKQVSLLGDFLKSTGVQFQVVFTSPSVRTVQTSKKILPYVNSQVRLIEAEEFYEATVNTMCAAINRLDDLFENVIVVGHNPSISMLHDYLCSESVGGFMPATGVWLKLEVDQWSTTTQHIAELVDYYYPGKMN